MELIKHRGANYKASLSAARRPPGSQRRGDKSQKKKEVTFNFSISKFVPLAGETIAEFIRKTFVLLCCPNYPMSISAKKVFFKSSNDSNRLRRLVL